VICGTPGNEIPGCVSLNVFGGPGTVNQDMLDYVSAPLVDKFTSDIKVLNAFVSGEAFELPAGSVIVGVGYENRKESLDSKVDSGKFMRAVTGTLPSPVSGAVEFDSFFGEARFPLLEGAPFAERLDLTIGFRRDDHSEFGANTTYQAGLEWSVIDGLLVRSTYGTVYRAPSISSLFGSQSSGFPPASDPCSTGNWGNLEAEAKSRCLADGVADGGSANLDGQQIELSGGNPNLQPEEGDTLTVGFVYSPDFVEGLDFTLDYWKIEIEDVISSFSARDILNGCYLGGVESMCEKVTRSFGELEPIDNPTDNLFARNASGIDFDVTYRFETSFGEFTTNLALTHNLKRENERFNSRTNELEMRDLTGFFSDDTSYFENKVSINVTYKNDDLTVSYKIGYLDELVNQELTYWGGFYTGEANRKEEGFENIDKFISYLDAGKGQSIDSYLYHDISASYNFENGTKVSVGVNNLTDEKPPYIESAFNGNTDESNYRLFGRSWFAKLTHKF
jgi:outer membrane receptor protein involved in Fe transport